MFKKFIIAMKRAYIQREPVRIHYKCGYLGQLLLLDGKITCDVCLLDKVAKQRPTL